MSVGFRTTRTRESFRERPYWSTDTMGNTHLDDLAIAWRLAVLAAGGTFTSYSIIYANQLAVALRAFSGYSKIVYLLPFLGNDIKAGRVPLIDTLGVGIALNAGSTAFVDADLVESAGLSNANESNKWLDSQIKPLQLNTSITLNGGFGWWETNWGNGTNVEPMGCYRSTGTDRYVLDFRTTVEAVRWGNPSNFAGKNGTAGAGHYYGQRSASNLREMYKNGTLLGQISNGSDAGSGSGDRNILIHGVNDSTAHPWKGRGSIAYLTDGTLTAAQVLELHRTLDTNFMVFTGRKTPDIQPTNLKRNARMLAGVLGQFPPAPIATVIGPPTQPQ